MKNYNDLLKELKSINSTGILRTDTESICDYQDMLANSTDSQLTELCNDSQYIESFYRLYGCAAGTVNAIKFHCQHSEKLMTLRDSEAYYREHAEATEQALKEAKEQAEELKQFRHDAEVKLADMEHEIMVLKAKLYDMMQTE